MTDIHRELEADAELDAASGFMRIAADYLTASRDRANHVSSAHDQAMLARRFDEPIPRRGMPIGKVLERLRDEVIPDSNWLHHPRAMGHQVAPPLPALVWTESVIAALNQSTAVFEMSPVGTTLERRVIRWMADLVGFGRAAAGTMTTGGTEATFTALLAARAAALPDSWENGVGANPPILVCGEHAHYAATRPAGELGLGLRSIVTVKSEGFQMSPRALRETLAAAKHDDRKVLAVVATAGSTPTGTFDDLTRIADVCDEFGAWLHVDAAHGGSALLSERHRARLAGIARARSVAWDPHKMMLLPLQAGVLIMRDAADLDRAYAQKAPYLFHQRDEPDQGTRSFLCSHRADSIKLWVALQRYGVDGIGALYDHLCAVTSAMSDAVKQHRHFESLHEPESNILCFRWIGDRSLDDARLDAINLEGRERYNRSGEGWVTTTVLRGRRVLRVTIMNPRTTADDAREVLEGLERECAALGNNSPRG
ncbi:MAG TPA: aminotransferase class I/II-fold pyridoxal phosphate-dependent enzyme [Gemmatimonadaceae bacterium]|nr:aminotransferase class I/II-fold pyridoxal phosphate-dependent enzyme [Gemmatimonadaceae bacterium]